MRAVLIVLSLSALALAGCLGGGGQTASAMDLREQAGSAAAAWADGPVLTGVISVEPFQRYFEEGEGEIIIHLDSSPGDGLAPGWVYLFDGGDRTVFVMVAAGLGVLAEGWLSDEEADEEFGVDSTIDGWTVDSDEAAAIIADETDWPAPMENTTMLWSLFQTEDGPVWFVEREDPDEDYYAAVHAGNGTLLENGTRTFSSYGYVHAWGSSSGALEADPLLEGAWAWVQIPATGTITLDVTVEPTVGAVRVVLDGPGGPVYDQALEGSDRFTLEDAPAGTYELDFRSDPVYYGSLQFDLLGEWSS